MYVILRIMSLILGDLEELILLSVKAYHPSVTVTGIRNRLTDKAQHPVSSGAIDRALRRLEQKGLTVSELITSKSDGSGRKNCHWQLTKKGAEALEKMETIRQSVRGTGA